MLKFTLITCLPIVLVGTAAVSGGAWVCAALLYMTALVATMDRLIAGASANADPEAEFPASEALLVLLGVSHFALLALSMWGVAGPSGLSIPERVILGAAAGLVFGQISHPVAHELIHKRPRFMRWIGQWMYTTLLVGHHASAHVLVHHVYVGSDQDPNSAPRGETFYRYMMRVTRQSFRAGLAAETTRRQRAGKAYLLHPYLIYVGGGAATLGAIVAVFGLIGGLAFLSIALHAQIQILMSDYVQHYGLRRARGDDGRLAPVGPQHSWNAPDVFSSFLMVNAPRHSDHHIAPSRAYPALQLTPDNMPCLPYSLPVMGVLALVPKIWFRLMNPLCDKWQDAAVAEVSSGAMTAHLAQSEHAIDPSPSVQSEPDLTR